MGHIFLYKKRTRLVNVKRRYIELIWYKAVAELKAEAARAYLGFMWWLVEPVLYMCAFYIVFGMVLQRGEDDFVAFLLCGLVVWKWFASTVLMSSGSIVSNAGLMQQVYLPKHIFPVIMVLINTIKFVVVFCMLLLFLLLYGYEASFEWFYLPIVLFVQLMLILGISVLVAAIVPLFPDLKVILENVVMLLMFLSGVFFDIDSVTGPVLYILNANPMLIIIDSYRSVLLEGAAPEMYPMLSILSISSLIIVAAYLLIYKYDKIYPRVLI